MSTFQDSSRPLECNFQAFLDSVQDDSHTSTQYSLLDNEPISEGEWHPAPLLPYDYREGDTIFSSASTPGCSNPTSDDDFYLKFLREVTHYPDDYCPADMQAGPLTDRGHLPLRTTCRNSRTDDDPTNTIAMLPDLERRPSLDNFYTPHNLSDGLSFASGLSPFEPSLDGCEVSLTTGAPNFLSESPLYAHAPSWSPQLSLFLDQGSQLGNLSLQAPPRSPSADLTLDIDTDADLILIFKTAQTPDRSSFFCGPVPEHGHQDFKCARDSWAAQASMAAIQELTSASAVALPIEEMSVDPAAAREILDGYVVPGNGVTNSTVHNHSSIFPHSVHQNEDAAPHDFLWADRASRHHVASFSAASIRVAPAGRHRGRFSCRLCDASFVQRQGYNRHNRDKHQPRNICPRCGVFKWSPARHYLFTGHLKRDHPGVAL